MGSRRTDPARGIPGDSGVLEDEVLAKHAVVHGDRFDCLYRGCRRIHRDHATVVDSLDYRRLVLRSPAFNPLTLVGTRVHERLAVLLGHR